MNELEKIRLALKEIIKESAIDDWLNSPNSSFDNQVPLKMIEEGNTEDIWDMIELLNSGEPRS